MADHGTRTSYVQGCHCDDCKKANADYRRRWEREWANKPSGAVHNCPCCTCPKEKTA